MLFTGNPLTDVPQFIGWFFNFCFVLPFSVPFFFFPFTYGHLIYGSMIISVACSVVSKILKGGKTIKND